MKMVNTSKLHRDDGGCIKHQMCGVCLESMVVRISILTRRRSYLTNLDLLEVHG